MPKKTAAKPAPEKPPATAFAPVVNAFAGRRDVTRGRMMSSYGLKVGGKIFAMYAGAGFVVKLPKARVDELVGRRAGTRFEPRPGRAMKEWIVVKAGAADWIELAEEAFRFVRQGAGDS